MENMANFNLVHTGLKTMAVLFIVIGLLVLILYLMKKFLFTGQGMKGDMHIKAISSLHFSPKERIEVVEISGERIVIGITPGSINFLTKLTNSNEKDRKIHENGTELPSEQL